MKTNKQIIQCETNFVKLKQVFVRHFFFPVENVNPSAYFISNKIALFSYTLKMRVMHSIFTLL